MQTKMPTEQDLLDMQDIAFKADSTSTSSFAIAAGMNEPEGSEEI